MLVLYLVNRHAAEWAYAHCGTVRFLFRPALGYWVLLRTPVLKEKWLASALLVRSSPRMDSDWQRIRAAFRSPSFPNPGRSQHQYLCVKGDALAQARRAMRGSDVTVLDVDRIHCCSTTVTR